MIHKYDSAILALLLAAMLSLVISVFSIDFFFLKELLLLAIMIIVSIAIFYGMTRRKKWVYSYTMLVFAIGLINGLYMHWMTQAKLAFLLVLVNFIGFAIILRLLPSRKHAKKSKAAQEPRIIIKEVEEVPITAGKAEERKGKKHVKASAKAKRMSEAELMKTEKQILDELDRAIEKKNQEMAKREKADDRTKQKAKFAKKGDLDVYYDSLDGVDLKNSYYDEKSSKAANKKKTEMKEVDDIIDEINEFAKEAKTAKKPARKEKAAKKAKKKVVKNVVKAKRVMKRKTKKR